jgi:NADPH2:quinone reductase
MRAAQVTALTGPAGVSVVEVPEPTLWPGQVLIDVHAVGVAFPDLLLSKGEYQLKPELPFTLGSTSRARSSRRSEGFEAGDRVVGVLPHGGASDRVASAAAFTFRLPDSMSFEAAAAIPMNYLTAHFALVERGGLKAGETVLVHGAAGVSAPRRSRWPRASVPG